MTLTPSQQWDEMTDQQKIEWLAVKVMGWFRRGENGWMQPVFVKSESVLEIPFIWNPLTDWNHWREVEERVMEDEYLQKRFIMNVCQAVERKDFDDSISEMYMMADLPTRCRALFLALQ